MLTMATKQQHLQYAAAAAAIHTLANQMIAKLGWFEQGAAKNALTDDLVNSFAKAAVDAALAVPNA
jgi:hypothetical protein